MFLFLTETATCLYLLKECLLYCCRSVYKCCSLDTVLQSWYSAPEQMCVYAHVYTVLVYQIHPRSLFCTRYRTTPKKRHSPAPIKTLSVSSLRSYLEISPSDIFTSAPMPSIFFLVFATVLEEPTKFCSVSLLLSTWVCSSPRSSSREAVTSCARCSLIRLCLRLSGSSLVEKSSCLACCPPGCSLPDLDPSLPCDCIFKPLAESTTLKLHPQEWYKPSLLSTHLLGFGLNRCSNYFFSGEVLAPAI